MGHLTVDSADQRGAVHGPSEEKASSSLGNGITFRAVSISIVILIVFAQIIERAEYFHLIPNVGTAVMPSPAAMAVLFVLLGLNGLFKLVNKRSCFSKPELVVIYSMVALGGWLLSAGFVGNSLPNRIVSLRTLAMQQPDKPFGDILAALSPLVAVSDQQAVMNFWIGNSQVPWRLWIPSILTLTFFHAVLLWCMLCVTVLIRRHWQDYERLTYPLTVPVLYLLDATEVSGNETDTPSVFRNKLFYIGALVPMLFGIFSVLNRYIPSIPSLVLAVEIGDYFNTPPFSAFNTYPSFRFAVDWLAIGVAYLIPLDVSFSFWFFTVLHQFQQVFMTAIGYPLKGMLGEACLREQSLGAGIGLFIMYMWAMRHHLKEVLAKVFNTSSANTLDDSNEPLSYKTAFWGLVIGLLLVLLLGRVLFKVPVLWTLLVVAVTISVYLSATRARVEAGAFHNANQAGQFLHDLPTYVGSERIGVSTYAYMQAYYGIFTLYGFFGAGLPIALETYKMADAVGMRKRGIVPILIFSFVVAGIVGMVTILPVAYERGMATTPDTFRVMMGEAAVRATHNVPAEPITVWVIAISAVFAGVLSVLRTNFIWFPFNPIGYLMSGMEWIMGLWGSFFIAWLVKFFILRYGGLTTFRQLQPVALGFIIGTAALSILSTIIAMVYFVFG